MDLKADAVEEAHATLSHDERERASRLSRAEVRDRFIVARAGLRKLLGRCLARNPGELEFAYADQGKPYLDGSQLFFNLSHSGDVAVYAITQGRNVGVDVEYVGRKVARDQVTRRFYATEEAAVIEAAAEVDRDRVFFSIWTLKEAFLKARGHGLSVSLDSFAVRPGCEASLLRLDSDPDATAEWKLVSVEIDDDYVAAVCGEGQDWKLDQLSWPES